MFRRSILASVLFVGFFFSIVATVSAQSYSPMYSPNSTQPQDFVCLDQYNQPVPYAYFFSTPACTCTPTLTSMTILRTLGLRQCVILDTRISARLRLTAMQTPSVFSA